MEANIKNKAMLAIERYLERRGFEILETGWAHGSDRVDFIAKDEDDALTFIACSVTDNDGSGFPEEKLDRESLERVAIAYLSEHPEHADITVSFDQLHMLIVGESRAMIRHHRGCMSHDLV